MANEVETQLVDALYDELQTERFATISTIDFETNGPNVSAISWLVAPTKQKIRFAVDVKSRIVENNKHTNKAVVNIHANESAE